MPFVVRTERLPIVEVVFPAHFEPGEYEELFERYVEVARTCTHVAYLLDMRTFDPLRASASKRRHAANVWKQNVARLQNSTLCEARIVSSELTRGVLTAFDWLTGTKWPCGTFTSPADAERFLAQHLTSPVVKTSLRPKLAG